MTLAYAAGLDACGAVERGIHGHDEERLKARLLVRDNGVDPPGAEITRTSAGIEPIYQDIKALTIPVATF